MMKMRFEKFWLGRKRPYAPPARMKPKATKFESEIKK